MITYFISDLHLQESAASANLFFKFLAEKAVHADALYILGDFFELWVGDDSDSIFLQKVKAALAKLATNVPVFFMHGNRDFLIGQDFIKETNCQLISDPSVIELYANKWLLTHGDALVNDKNYQRFRYLSRHKIARFLFLLLPLKFRLSIAKKMRDDSQSHYQDLVKTSPQLLDVCQNMVENILTKHNAVNIIHGHTHIPDIHQFKLGDTIAKRIVLGSWGKQAKILSCTPDGYQLETI